MATPSWTLTGNAGINPQNDFLGTTDSQPLIVKTSGTERIRVNANGKVGIGILDPTAQLSLGNYDGIRQLVWDGDLNNTQNENCGFGIDLTGTGSFDIFMGRDYGLNIVTPTGPWPFPGYSARLTVLSNGNIGIGNTSPNYSLHLAAGKVLRIEGSAGNDSANYFSFGGNGTFGIDAPGVPNGRLVVENSGKVGIGTTAPAFPLDVNGDIGVNGRIHLGYSVIASGFNPASFGSLGGSTLILSTAEGMPTVGGGVVYVSGERLRITSAGQVGIGTSSPLSLLEADVSAPGALGPALTLTNTGGGINAAAAIDFNTFPPQVAAPPVVSNPYNPSSRIEAVDAGNYNNEIVFESNRPGAPNNGLVELMRLGSSAVIFPADILLSGNIGIGTVTPQERLSVNGNVTVTGDILLTGADCAEDFDVSDGQALEPGTVVVIADEGALCESREPYDKKVAGVVSGAGEYRHGVVLDKRSAKEKRVPVALVGKVYCKVDAQYSPVEVGDLLTTSPTPGHAMKAAEPDRALGTVIGKALGVLKNGSGLIPILIALQ